MRKKVLQGLLHYPYGCAEQTTSTSYPWLFIDEAAAKRYGLPAHSRAEREAVLEKSFAKLGAYQAPNGGFSMWGEGNAHDYWLSAYITHFLQDARAESFNVPAPLYDKAIGYLQAQMAPGIASLPANPLPWSGASNWEHYWNFRNHNFEALAFGAMVLAQDRKVQLSSLRQLFDLRGNANSGLSLVELGIALQLMGDAPRAQTALSEGLAKPRVSGNYWYDYGSDLRDAAQSFVLLHRYKIDVKGDGVLLTQMVEGLKRQPYYSTQDQLAVYLAARVLESYATAEGWSATLGTESGAQALSGTQAQYMPLPQAESTGHSLTNTGKTRLFAVMNSVGNPKQLGEGTPRLLIKRSLFDADGRPLPPSPSLKVGQTVWIEVQTLSDAFTPNALVVDRLPAGLEIENTHLIQGESGGAVSVDGVNPAAAMTDPRVGHVEFRDDRFVAAVRLGNWWGGPLRLFYRARVVTPGRFVLPQSSVEDMYAPQIHAASKGVGVVTVEDARTPVSAPVKWAACPLLRLT